MAQNILNDQLDTIQDNIIRSWARPTVSVTAQEDKEEEILTEVKASVTKTAIPEVVSSFDPALTNNESKPPKKQPTDKANNFCTSKIDFGRKVNDDQNR